MTYVRQEDNPPQVYRHTNGFAIASLVSALVAWIPGGQVLAVIFGHIALRQIAADPDQDGRRLAVAGLVIGYAAIVIIAFVVLGIVVGHGS